MEAASSRRSLYSSLRKSSWDRILRRKIFENYSNLIVLRIQDVSGNEFNGRDGRNMPISVRIVVAWNGEEPAFWWNRKNSGRKIVTQNWADRRRYGKKTTRVVVGGEKGRKRWMRKEMDEVGGKEGGNYNSVRDDEERSRWWLTTKVGNEER